MVLPWIYNTLAGNSVCVAEFVDSVRMTRYRPALPEKENPAFFPPLLASTMSPDVFHACSRIKSIQGSVLAVGGSSGTFRIDNVGEILSVTCFESGYSCIEIVLTSAALSSRPMRTVWHVRGYGVPANQKQKNNDHAD
jgi:hypothetical protein